MVAAGELLEHAEFAGNLYGTPRRAVLDRLDQGIPTLLEIELDGARQVRRSMPDAQFVFLAPPSLDELVHRLSGRGTESAEAVAARLKHAEAELAAEGEFDEVVVNGDVHQAARDVAALLRGAAATAP
jgi:guanylate kinase